MGDNWENKDMKQRNGDSADDTEGHIGNEAKPTIGDQKEVMGDAVRCDCIPIVGI
jgi:hypothetical protein